MNEDNLAHTHRFFMHSIIMIRQFTRLLHRVYNTNCVYSMKRREEKKKIILQNLWLPYTEVKRKKKASKFALLHYFSCCISFSYSFHHAITKRDRNKLNKSKKSKKNAKRIYVPLYVSAQSGNDLVY